MSEKLNKNKCCKDCFDYECYRLGCITSEEYGQVLKDITEKITKSLNQAKGGKRVNFNECMGKIIT